MHDAWLIAVPTLLILAGIFFNNSVAKELRSEMKGFRSELKSEMKELRTELRSEMKEFRTDVKSEIMELRTEMRGRFDMIDAELRYFHGTIGKLETRVEAIEKHG